MRTLCGLLSSRATAFSFRFNRSWANLIFSIRAMALCRTFALNLFQCLPSSREACITMHSTLMNHFDGFPSTSAAAISTSASPQAPAVKFGKANDRRKRFNNQPQQRTKGYDYEWVVVKGGQRMLARAPAGTKRWHIWTSQEELGSKQLQQQRRAQQGRSGTWLVDASGALLR